jgi:hypothetical protein
MTNTTTAADIMTDEQVNRMHYRQAEILIQVPAEDRQAVLSSAYLMMNMTATNLSGALWSCVQEYRRVGAEAMARQDRLTNARAMGWPVDENGHRIDR